MTTTPVAASRTAGKSTEMPNPSRSTMQATNKAAAAAVAITIVLGRLVPRPVSFMR